MENGNMFPTGASPFSTDLATPMNAITDRMIKTRLNQIAQDRSEVAQNEKNMLEALSFETVQGLSDQVQVAHLAKVEDLTNAGAELMAKRKGKLTYQDQLWIKQQQRKVETDIANMKSDVQAFAQIQKDITTNPDKFGENFDVDATVAAMDQYRKNGLIGTGGAPFLPVPKQRNGAELLMANPAFAKSYDEMSKQKNETINGLDKNDPNYNSLKYNIEREFGIGLKKWAEAGKNLPGIRDNEKYKKQIDDFAGSHEFTTTQDVYRKPDSSGPRSGKRDPLPELAEAALGEAARLAKYDSSTLNTVSALVGASGADYDYDKGEILFRFKEGDNMTEKRVSLPKDGDLGGIRQLAIDLSRMKPASEKTPKGLDKKIMETTKILDTGSEINVALPSTLSELQSLAKNPTGKSTDGKKDIANWRVFMQYAKPLLPSGWNIEEEWKIFSPNELVLTGPNSEKIAYTGEDSSDMSKLYDKIEELSTIGNKYRDVKSRSMKFNEEDERGISALMKAKGWSRAETIKFLKDNNQL